MKAKRDKRAMVKAIVDGLNARKKRDEIAAELGISIFYVSKLKKEFICTTFIQK